MNRQSADAQVIVSRDGKRTITAKEFDRLFDEGSDEIEDFLDWDNARRPGLVPKRVNVDFPADFVTKDLAGRKGVYAVELVEVKEKQ